MLKLDHYHYHPRNAESEVLSPFLFESNRRRDGVNNGHAIMVSALRRYNKKEGMLKKLTRQATTMGVKQTKNLKHAYENKYVSQSWNARPNPSAQSRRGLARRTVPGRADV